jgi:Fe-S oxidoreductase
MGIEERQGTCSHGGILESISRIMTSPDMKQDRLQWLDKDLKTSTNGEYLYFVGCLPYFDVLFEDLDVNAANIARSTVKILNQLGIEPQVLANEKCCGHDFYWNGDIKNFEKLAHENLKMITESGAKKIVTSCPECYRTLSKDYKEFNGINDFHVLHISEVINHKHGESKPNLKADQQTITFQDPCRLGRHMGVYKAPREVIGHIEGIELKEMAHHHKRAICCGVSGWMNCSQVSKQIQAQRLNEAVATGAETLVTSCAKCKIHFSCALQDDSLKKKTKIKIKDLTELVADAMC